MHSKGVRTRTVKHQVLQDGFFLVLKVKQRRWMCTNIQCRHIETDRFTFLSPGRRTTNQTDFMILNAFRNAQLSASDIAKQFNVSDTHTINVFERYIDMKRLPLSEVISIDEVHLDMPGCKYALVIYDFISGEPIDILPSRTDSVTEEYFSQIPAKERILVKYLISDMYAPYLNYVGKYFPNAAPVVDSFHVIKYLNLQLDDYIKALLDKYLIRDENRKRLHGYSPSRHYRQSDEVYLLKHKKWIILSNPSKLKDLHKPRWDKHFHAYLDLYSYEEFFRKIDPNLSELRRLTIKYYDFNEFCVGNPSKASEKLDYLISLYISCPYPIFHDFARLLRKRRVEIINSFNTVICNGEVRRLSNGPIESLNRIPKDMKRRGRGYLNFEHFRSRLLFSLRNDAPILAIPKDLKMEASIQRKSRYSYKKRHH